MAKATTNRCGSDALQAMAIPRVHWKARWDALPDEAYVDRIREWLKNVRVAVQRGRGLVLFGPYSHGKSALATICLKVAWEKGVPGYWVSARNVAGYQINRTMYSDAVSVWEHCLEVPLLVVDEVLVSSDAGYAQNVIEYLIRERVDEQRATILTTNVPRSEFNTKYPAFAAVLDEAVSGWIKVEGYDFRKDEERRCPTR